MGIEMKKIIIAALLLGTSYSGAALAEDPISANVALSTDYRFRGISQTDRDPAISGGFDYGHESGIYVGTWASNVSFTAGGTEIDAYAGWSGDVAENIALDLGVLYYAYPEDNDADYVEIYGSVGFFGATLGVNYSPEYTYDTGNYWYLYGQYSLPLGDTGLSLDAHLGWNLFEDDEAFGSFIGSEDAGDNYIDYSIGLTYPFAGIDLTLAYVGTDISKSDCFGGDKACQGNAVFSISKSF
jgi:uncharacterized protein (TIGR02001 family)